MRVIPKVSQLFGIIEGVLHGIFFDIDEMHQCFEHKNSSCAPTTKGKQHLKDKTLDL